MNLLLIKNTKIYIQTPESVVYPNLVPKIVLNSIIVVTYSNIVSSLWPLEVLCGWWRVMPYHTSKLKWLFTTTKVNSLVQVGWSWVFFCFFVGAVHFITFISCNTGPWWSIKMFSLGGPTFKKTLKNWLAKRKFVKLLIRLTIGWGK